MEQEKIECDEDDCELEVYENSKCILHCEKKDWDKNTEKVKFFWDKITDDINDTNSKKQEQEEYDIPDNAQDIVEYEFKNINFPTIINDYHFSSLENNIDIIFNNCKFLGKTNFSDLQKARAIKFKKCHFYKKVNFSETTYNHLFIFEECKVYENIEFYEVTFNSRTSFIKTECFNSVIFIYTKFESLVFFNKFEAVDLKLLNTFFKDEVTFVGVSIKNSNRETARIIKHSFDKIGNIIEANKYYALEMEKREEELRDRSNEDYNLKDWMIFKFHKISSNHSQDWLLTLIWIFNITILMSHWNFFIIDEKTEYYVIAFMLNVITIVIMTFSYKNICKILWSFISYLIYIFITDDYFLCFLANTINPFSIMTGIESLTFLILVYKIIISYLIYQFIISVRQNTRRK